MRTTAGSLDVVVPCESRNVTSLEGIDLLLDFLDSLFSVPSAQNLCGEQVLNLQFIKTLNSNTLFHQRQTERITQSPFLCFS